MTKRRSTSTDSPARRERSAELAGVERAVVQFTKTGGRGVLVPGGFILTAAHCVAWSPDGSMALGEDYIEKVRTAAGEELLLAVLAVELVTDIAALGAPDHQRYSEEAEAFDAFAEPTAAISLFRGEMAPGDVHERFGPRDYSLPVFVFNLGKEWVKATASVVHLGQAKVTLRTEKPIEGGASGGPVVTPEGQLVGIVSSGAEFSAIERKGREFHAVAIRPLYALPVWVVNGITAAE